MKIKEILQLKEFSSSGSTSSGAIATVAIPLGGWIGFDPSEQWKSIYNTNNKKKKGKRKKN